MPLYLENIDPLKDGAIAQGQVVRRIVRPCQNVRADDFLGRLGHATEGGEAFLSLKRLEFYHAKRGLVSSSVAVVGSEAKVGSRHAAFTLSHSRNLAVFAGNCNRFSLGRFRLRS
jgi:hypothetical protein